jgi:tryptophan halogenase
VTGSDSIRSVVIAGAGVVGLSAALGFARALPGAAVTVIGGPLAPGALADRLPAMLPATLPVLDRMGVTEADLVRAGGATHRLADRFSGWRADNGVWLHGFGETGAGLGAGAFHQRWLEARRTGYAAAYHHFSPAAALAEAGRFVHPVPDERSLLSRFAYALRLDPVATARHLAARAGRSGVVMTAGPVLSIARRPDGGVGHVHLSDGRTLAADLFIDCSGPLQLLGQADDWSDWSDWSDALPPDRLLLAAGPGAPSPLDDYQAGEIGWRASWPLRDRTLSGLAYVSALTPEARARRIMGPAGEVAEAVAIRPGRRRSPWRGNVLALGDAAAACGPLGCAGLVVAHANLELALDLLPGRDLPPLLIAEYNRRAVQRADRVRDFLSLHYVAAGRSAGPFWRALRRTAPPPAVALALETFARHGHLPRHEEELFDKQSWLAVLLGSGLVPAHPDPMTTGADTATSHGAMERLRAAVAGLSAPLPVYADYLARIAAA